MERVRWLRVIFTMTTIAACVTYVHLSSTEQHTVVPSTTNLAFGTKQIGTMTALPITISPETGASSSDTVLSISENCAGFAFSGPANPNAPVVGICMAGPSGSGSGSMIGSEQAAAGSGSAEACDIFTAQSYTFNAIFQPTVANFQSCTLTVTMSSGTTININLNGTGQAPPIDIEIAVGDANGTTPCTTCSLDFGEVNVGSGPSPSPKVVKVINAGSGTATLTNATVAAPYSATGFTAGQTIGPGAAATIDVNCDPSAAGGAQRTLAISTNDPAMPNYSVTLDCTGVITDLFASQTAVSINTRVFDPPPGLPITLRNDGSVAIAINSVQLVPVPATGFLSFTGPADTNLSPSETTTVTLNYNPTDVDALSTVLRVTFTGSAGTETKNIPIEGGAVATTMSLAPVGSGVADLGVVCAGTTKLERFTVIADSSGSFDVTDLDITNGGPMFDVRAVSPATLPTPANHAPVAGGGLGTVEFDIGFTPTVPGLALGVMVLKTDIPQMGGGTKDVSLNLMGSGLPAGTNLTPVGPIDFGTMPTGMASTKKIVTLTNCSDTAVPITRTEIIGDQDFMITMTPGTEVPARGQVEFELALAPEFGGAKRGELEVEYGGGLSKVVLIGNGDGPLRPIDEDDPFDPRDSYYACSTGDASGSLFVMFVVGAVVLRRRRRLAK